MAGWPMEQAASSAGHCRPTGLTSQHLGTPFSSQGFPLLYKLVFLLNLYVEEFPWCLQSAGIVCEVVTFLSCASGIRVPLLRLCSNDYKPICWCCERQTGQAAPGLCTPMRPAAAQDLAALCPNCRMLQSSSCLRVCSVEPLFSRLKHHFHFKSH